MKKRLQQILARKAEIKQALEGADEARLAEFSTEVDALSTEEAELRSKLDLVGRLKEPEAKPQERAGGEIEERARQFRQDRAVTITNSTTLIQPTQNQQAINGMIGAPFSSIVDLVKVTDCNGMSEYLVPYQTSYSEAGKTAENTEAQEGQPEFDYASIKPITLATYSEVSRETMRLTDVAYYNKVVESAGIALRKKVAEYIVSSDAATNPTFIGIKVAPAITADSDVEIDTIEANTLRRIAMHYGGDESIVGNAVLFLSKADLIAFGDVRGTNEKKYVYEITPDTENPNTGIIKDGGLSVRYCLNSNITSLADATAEEYTMIYGMPACYEIGLFGNFNVRVSEDAAFRRRMIAVLGEVMIGGNVVVKDGFVRVKKS